MAKRSRKSKPVREVPTCNCVLLCDDVVTSARGKHTLVGVIGMIAAQDFPTTLGGYVTYVRLSNIYPNQSVQIEMERAEDRTTMFQFDIKVREPEPLGLYTFVVVVPPFVVDRPGKYWFQAVSDGEPLAQSPIEIVSVRPSQQGSQP